MAHLRDNRKALIAFAIIIACVAVAVPTCRMVGCQMETMGYMPFTHLGDGLALSSDCGGAWSILDVTVGVVPLGLEALALALFAAFAAVAVLMRPQVVARPVRILDATPPPPPERPLGTRLTL